MKRIQASTHYPSVRSRYPGFFIHGEPSPVPVCPSGRILARPERARMRLPFSQGWADCMEEMWQVQYVNGSKRALRLT